MILITKQELKKNPTMETVYISVWRFVWSSVDASVIDSVWVPVWRSVKVSVIDTIWSFLRRK